MNSNIDMNNFYLKVKPVVNNSDIATLQFIKSIIHTFLAKYDREDSPYIRNLNDSILVFSFDINLDSLQLIIFGGPGRLGIETNINNNRTRHKIN